jgi:hypothetical protein
MELELDKPQNLDFMISSVNTIMEHVVNWAKDSYDMDEDEFNGIYKEVYGNFVN